MKHFWEGRPFHKRVPGQALWVNETSTLEQFAEGYALTDFWTWPHVGPFASLPELLEDLLAADFDNLSALMGAEAAAALPRSERVFQEALASLLDFG